ncbi:hypothetical protein HYY75_07175, partial [bacterium]|nr:hypothetical protein [bacterium]
KPEKYVMVAIEHGEISIGGKAGPAAFVDIRNIGYLSGDTTQKISGRICSRLRELLAIPGDRVYLNFTDISPYNWGWNGKTFG